jgi:hypothetical protein
MPPPDHFVMSTGVVGPLGARHPAGVVHAVARSFPPTHTTLCGRAHKLYLFADLDFRTVDVGPAGKLCPTCAERLVDVAPA